MPVSLQQAVGKDSPNHAVDVKVVTDLLNAVPATQGGPAKPLAVGAGASDDLVKAINKFQQNQFWTKLGRVDPQSATYYRLLAFQPGLIQAPPNTVRGLIASYAVIMGMADPISDEGKVVNQDLRKGHDTLKLIFDEVLETPINWADPTKREYKLNKSPYQVTNLDGVQKASMRVPQGGGLGIQWCGIFAAWIWKKAMTGASVSWRLGRGPIVGGKALKASGRVQGLAPGDIAIRKDADPKNQLIHHFVVVALSPDGKKVYSVDGNSDYQKIKAHEYGYNDIAYYYSVDTALRPKDVYSPIG